MQMQLPIFPRCTKLINSSIGIFEKDDFVYYLHNGSPIHCHAKNDLNSYRYITAELVVTGLCKPSELFKAIGVSNRNIQRYAKALREKGANWFFNREENRGRAHKLTDDVLSNAQQMINDFYSITDVARLLGVTEGALRYHIKKGNIKKNGNSKEDNPARLTTPATRNQQDILVSNIIGVGATNIEDRGLAVNHQLEDTPRSL